MPVAGPLQNTAKKHLLQPSKSSQPCTFKNIAAALTSAVAWQAGHVQCAASWCRLQPCCTTPIIYICELPATASVHRLRCCGAACCCPCCPACLPGPQHVAGRHQRASQSRQLLPQTLPLFAGEGAVMAAADGHTGCHLVNPAVQQLAANGTHHPGLDLQRRQKPEGQPTTTILLSASSTHVDD